MGAWRLVGREPAEELPGRGLRKAQGPDMGEEHLVQELLPSPQAESLGRREAGTMNSPASSDRGSNAL